MSKCEMCIHKCVCRFQESDNECVYFRKENRTVFTTEILEKAIALHDQNNMTWDEIGNELCVNSRSLPPAVCKFKKQNKIIAKRRRPRKVFTTEILEKAIALRNQNNMTWDDIGKELDVNGRSLHTLINRLRKRGELK